MMAAHSDILQSYICDKNKWSNTVFQSVDWMGFNGFLSKLDNVRQTNVIKLVHNWINDGHQQDLFSNQLHFTECPADCGQIETHQHYISCYAPPMLTQNTKCVISLRKQWAKLRTAIPIARALKYIITCVISETEPLQRRLPASATPFDIMLFQAWQEQRLIGWQQLFKGRLSKKWALAQGLYYADNPETKHVISFSPSLWASKTVQILIDMALEMWGTRNKQLHGTTPEEERLIQRRRAITIVKTKYAEGFRNVQARFPVLYRESLLKLCDRSTLQLLKWIETYEVYRCKINRENTAARRGLLKTIKSAYKDKAGTGQYGAMALFNEPRRKLIRRTTHYLSQWVARYSSYKRITGRDAGETEVSLCQDCARPPGPDSNTQTAQPIRGLEGGNHGLGGTNQEGG